MRFIRSSHGDMFRGSLSPRNGPCDADKDPWNNTTEVLEVSRTGAMLGETFTLVIRPTFVNELARMVAYIEQIVFFYKHACEPIDCGLSLVENCLESTILGMCGLNCGYRQIKAGIAAVGVVGRFVVSGRKRLLRLTSTHLKAVEIQASLMRIGEFMKRISAIAEQLDFNRIWELIILAAFRKWLGGNRPGGLLPKPLAVIV